MRLMFGQCSIVAVCPGLTLTQVNEAQNFPGVPAGIHATPDMAASAVTVRQFLTVQTVFREASK